MTFYVSSVKAFRDNIFGYFLHHVLVLVRTSSNQGARFLAGNRHIPVRLLWVCGYDNYIGGAVCIHICLPCLQRGAGRFHYYCCTCIPALPSLEEVHTRFRGAHISEHRVSYPERPSTQLRLHIAGGPLYINTSTSVAEVQLDSPGFIRFQNWGREPPLSGTVLYHRYISLIVRQPHR